MTVKTDHINAKIIVERNKETVHSYDFKEFVTAADFKPVNDLRSELREIALGKKESTQKDVEKIEKDFFQREQFWIKRLKTLAPHGLNKRQELPPPIPFTIKFNDQACDIARLVKTAFQKIQERSGHVFWRSQIVTAYKRNPNLSDFLVNCLEGRQIGPDRSRIPEVPMQDIDLTRLLQLSLPR